MTTNTNLQPTSEALGTEPIGLAHVDPATLLIDSNVRLDARLDPEFLASVADLGVLVPIVAVRTPAGDLRVRYGHRRTLAAVEAGHAYVPVVVAADEVSDDDAEVERLVGQYAENEHRTGLSTAERVEVFTQLAAFGVSAAQIAKRTKVHRGEVKAALTIGESDLAKAVTGRCEFLDLMQAAVVAEFEDDPEAVKALVKAARDGGFEHLAQRLRDERTEAAAVAKVTDELRAAGVAVIEAPSYWNRGSVTELDRLRDSSGEALSVEAHRSCPGHAAYAESQWAGAGDDTDHEEGVEWVAFYVCTDPTAYGHASRWEHRRTLEPAPVSDEEREAARVERRRVLANNKAWRSAEVVRRAWLSGFLARKSAPKDAAGFIAESLVRGDRELIDALDPIRPQKRESRELLGETAVVEGASPSRAQMIGLGVVLAAYEVATGTHSWRNVSESTARYLRYLAAHGYELADVERLACGGEPQSEDTSVA